MLELVLANKTRQKSSPFFPLSLLARLIVGVKDAVLFWRREVRNGEKGCCVVLRALLHSIFLGPDRQGGDHTPRCLNVSAGGEMAPLH